jgi:hypothetical protein
MLKIDSITSHLPVIRPKSSIPIPPLGRGMLAQFLLLVRSRHDADLLEKTDHVLL